MRTCRSGLCAALKRRQPHPCSESTVSAAVLCSRGDKSAPNTSGISKIVPIPCKLCQCVSWPGQVAVQSLQRRPFEPMSWTSHLAGVWQEMMFPYVDHHESWLEIIWEKPGVSWVSFLFPTIARGVHLESTMGSRVGGPLSSECP